MARTAQSSPKKEPSLDFSTYSFSELVEIKTTLESEIQSRQANEIEDLRAKVSEAAHALGVSVEQIFGLRSGSKRVRGMREARNLRDIPGLMARNGVVAARHRDG